MSDASHSHDDGPHEGPIKTPKQLLVTIFLSFVVPVIAIVLLASYVTDNKRPAAGSDGLTPESIALRLAPVGKVEVKDVSNPATLKTGAQVVEAQCAACHGAGLAGAPKIGDAAAWAARITQGYEVLLTSALKGKNAMGAQGGGDYSDLEIGRAVVHMANLSGAKFPEPALPAAADAPVADAAPEPAEQAAPAAAEAPAAPADTAAAPAAAAPTAAPAAPLMAAAAPVVAAAATSGPPALYTQACSVCHTAGIAGAPKTGDKAAWAPRVVAGIDALTASAIKGKGAMPPRGGSQGSDADIKAVVTYMVNSVK